MSALKDRITNEVKTAMRARDKERLAALRLIQAAIKQKEVDERIELDDVQVLSTLDKMVKQHRDSIEQFEKASRNDLADKEKFELNIIREFLPSQLSDDEINESINAAIDKSSAETIKDMGKVMGLLKPELQGRADMGKVSGLVKQRLTS